MYHKTTVVVSTVSKYSVSTSELFSLWKLNQNKAHQTPGFVGLTEGQHSGSVNVLQICSAQFFKGFSQSWSVCPLTEYLTSRRQSLFSSPRAHVQPAQWWICNYWWLHISSELLQSAGMVIVKEVICIKLIIRRNKAHKSGHCQFSWKCFKCTLLCRLQGKKGKDSPFFPNQESNLSDRTKTRLTQWFYWGTCSIFGTRNELLFNCVLLNLINGAIKEELYFRALFTLNSSSAAPPLSLLL